MPTLSLGSLDLSSYLRLGDQDGFDPYGQSFEDPAFTDAAFGYGRPLSNVAVGNRELAIPLYLNGASKTALHALVVSINRVIANEKPLRVSWQDDGAADPTFFDVAYARFEPNYHHKRADKNWLGGVLKVTANPPFGHTGTYRQVAQASGNGSWALKAVATPMLGDAPAIARIDIQAGSILASGFHAKGRVIGAAAIPHASYAGIIPAASFTKDYNAATTIAANASSPAYITGNVAAQRRRYLTHLSPASVYAGRDHRILALAAGAGIGWWAEVNGERLGPTAVATSGWEFAPVDLGVMRVPSNYPLSTISLRVESHGEPSLCVGKPEDGNERLSDVLIFPDDAFMLITDADVSPLAADTTLKVPSSVASIAENRYDQLGNLFTIPTVSGLASHGLVNTAAGAAVDYGFWPLTAVGTAVMQGLAVQHREAAALHSWVEVGDITRQYTVRKYGRPPSFEGSYIGLDAVIFQASAGGGGGTCSLALFHLAGGGTTLLASIGLQTAVTVAPDVFGEFDSARLELFCEDTRAWALFHNERGITLAGGSQYTIACVGASSLAAAIPGRTAFAVTHASHTNMDNDVAIFGVGVEVLQASGLTPRDLYRLDHTGQVVRHGAGSIARDITSRARGQRPLELMPSAVHSILAFAVPYSGTLYPELLNVTVSVREQFRFAR